LFEADTKLSVELDGGLRCPTCKLELRADNVVATTTAIELLCIGCGESPLMITCDDDDPHV
jgi:hypothetical protein